MIIRIPGLQFTGALPSKPRQEQRTIQEDHAKAEAPRDKQNASDKWPRQVAKEAHPHIISYFTPYSFG